MKNKITRKTGFTLIEIMIVVAIIGLLAAMAIPNFVHSRQVAQTNACISNLRCIDGAKQQWALENGRQNTDTPMGSDLQPYLGRSAAGSLPSCPVDAAQTFATSYAPQSVGAKPVCLIIPTAHVLP
jgi:prepilin-type N-terminal cleavage/methylation domain-containing protein